MPGSAFEDEMARLQAEYQAGMLRLAENRFNQIELPTFQQISLPTSYAGLTGMLPTDYRGPYAGMITGQRLDQLTDARGIFLDDPRVPPELRGKNTLGRDQVELQALVQQWNERRDVRDFGAQRSDMDRNFAEQQRLALQQQANADRDFALQANLDPSQVVGGQVLPDYLRQHAPWARQFAGANQGRLPGYADLVQALANSGLTPEDYNGGRPYPGQPPSAAPGILWDQSRGGYFDTVSGRALAGTELASTVQQRQAQRWQMSIGPDGQPRYQLPQGVGPASLGGAPAPGGPPATGPLGQGPTVGLAGGLGFAADPANPLLAGLAGGGPDAFGGLGLTGPSTTGARGVEAGPGADMASGAGLTGPMTMGGVRGVETPGGPPPGALGRGPTQVGGPAGVASPYNPLQAGLADAAMGRFGQGPVNYAGSGATGAIGQGRITSEYQRGLEEQGRQADVRAQLEARQQTLQNQQAQNDARIREKQVEYQQLIAQGQLDLANRTQTELTDLNNRKFSLDQEIQRGQLALAQGQAVGFVNGQQTLERIGLFGEEDGRRTLEAQRLYGGGPGSTPTLERESLYGGSALVPSGVTAQERANQNQAALGYLGLIGQNRGPADIVQYARIVGGTPNGLRDVVDASLGRFRNAGYGDVGGAPQAGGTLDALAPNDRAVGEVQAAQRRIGAANPQQFAWQNVDRLAPANRQMLGALAEGSGRRPEDVEAARQQALGRYRGPTRGRILAG